MSDLFTVSVDSVEGSTLRGRVHLVHPDAPEIPEGPGFPLTLLAEAWWELTHGCLYNDDRDGGNRYPLSKERGRDVAANMRLRDELSEIWDLVVGKEIRVTEDGYLLADDGETVLEPRRRAQDVYQLDGSYRHDGGSYRVQAAGDQAEFDRRTARIVTSYEVGPYQNVPLRSEVAAHKHPGRPWDSREPDGPAGLEDPDVWAWYLPRPFAERAYAAFVVTVRDAGCLEHMVAGMRWSTAVFGEAL